MKELNSNRYDAIVIGSGVGGLSTAALLSKINKKKVLVLERHWILGGQTHVFKRKGKYKWAYGVHYVGELHKGGPLRSLFDYITNEKLQWSEMPLVMDRFRYKNFSFYIKSDLDQYKQDLIERFPQEKKAIDTFVKKVKFYNAWYRRDAVSKFLPSVFALPLRLINAPFEKKAMMDMRKYADENFKDECLRCLINYQWGGYGLPPGQTPFSLQSFVTGHYMNRAYFPEGGSDQIATHIIPQIEEKGGQCLINHEVEEIIVKDNTAIGVKVNFKKGGKSIAKEFYAPLIISAAGAYETFNYLLPKSVNIPYRKEIEKFQSGMSFAALYVGFKECPSKFGFKGENNWLLSYPDFDKVVENLNKIKDGEIGYLFVSFSSLKDKKSTGHTAELITFIDYDTFAKWKGQKWQNREEDYYLLKNKISEAILNHVEKFYPGFRDNVEFTELSTPVTIEDFTGRNKGMSYGIPATSERMKTRWLHPKTPVKNLYLTGSDVFTVGVAGALLGGVATTSVINGFFGIFKIFFAVLKDASARKKKNKDTIIDTQQPVEKGLLQEA